MSIKHFHKAIEYLDCNTTEKLILILIANYADENDSCFPSLKHLAHLSRKKTVKPVRDAIKKFEEKNIIRKEHRKREDGGYTSNRYYLLWGSVGKDTGVGIDKDTTLVLPVTTNTKDNTKINNKQKHFENFAESIFQKIWSFYPRKVNKKKSFEVFKKLLKDEKDQDEFVKMLESKMKEYKRFCSSEKIDIQFIPHLSTWLNNERFKDEFDIKKIDKNTWAG